MHACLCVDEIVRLIACELVESRATATAIALACCCKNFEDSMLDALWGTQDQLLPLLKSLPEDVWNERECNVSTPTTGIFSSLNFLIRKSFKRLPTAQEWARFRKYARRMRRLVERGALDVLSLEGFSALQLRTINEPLFPNLKTLALSYVAREFIPFIPLFLSPRTTTIAILSFESDFLTATIASTITAFPILCPNLQNITLHYLPRDPMITAAVSGILLTNHQNLLRHFWVDSPLTEEAREVVSKLPNLQHLSVVVERGTSLPPVVLPNLTEVSIKYDHDCDWLQMFHLAVLGKLETVTFRSGSEHIGDFLETFEMAALAASVQNTLSKFYHYASRSWNPNYSSLLQFAQLTILLVEFPCGNVCTSNVDDDIITNLARAMPRLETLQLGDVPCREILTSITVKGLAALAHRCPGLYTLRIHFQVTSLSTPPTSTSYTRSTVPQRDCALENLEVGDISIPEESVPMVALTLVQIFPHIDYIEGTDGNWDEVMDAICLSRQIDNCSGKEHPLPTPRGDISDAPSGATLEDGS